MITSEENGRGILSRRVPAAALRAAAALVLAAAAPPVLQPPAAIAAVDQERSLFVSPLPWLIPEGGLQAIVSPSVSLRTPQPFHERGERVERTAVGLPVELAGALAAGVEASLSFGAARTGGRDDSDGVTPSDLTLQVGYGFPSGPAWMDSLSTWLTAKAPTGPDEGGVSTDEADLALGASAGWTPGRLALFTHLGVELLGNPLRNGGQDDVARYGAGASWRAARDWTLSAEVEGRAFSRFGNSAARVHAGGAWRAEGEAAVLSVGAVGFHGLNDDAATWGARVFLSVASFGQIPRGQDLSGRP